MMIIATLLLTCSFLCKCVLDAAFDDRLRCFSLIIAITADSDAHQIALDNQISLLGIDVILEFSTSK